MVNQGDEAGGNIHVVLHLDSRILKGGQESCRRPESAEFQAVRCSLVCLFVYFPSRRQ